MSSIIKKTLDQFDRDTREINLSGLCSDTVDNENSFIDIHTQLIRIMQKRTWTPLQHIKLNRELNHYNLLLASINPNYLDILDKMLILATFADEVLLRLSKGDTHLETLIKSDLYPVLSHKIFRLFYEVKTGQEQVHSQFYTMTRHSICSVKVGDQSIYVQSDSSSMKDVFLTMQSLNSALIVIPYDDSIDNEQMETKKMKTLLSVQKKFYGFVTAERLGEMNTMLGLAFMEFIGLMINENVLVPLINILIIKLCQLKVPKNIYDYITKFSFNVLPLSGSDAFKVISENMPKVPSEDMIPLTASSLATGNSEILCDEYVHDEQNDVLAAFLVNEMIDKNINKEAAAWIEELLPIAKSVICDILFEAARPYAENKITLQKAVDAMVSMHFDPIKNSLDSEKKMKLLDIHNNVIKSKYDLNGSFLVDVYFSETGSLGISSHVVMGSKYTFAI